MQKVIGRNIPKPSPSSNVVTQISQRAVGIAVSLLHPIFVLHKLVLQISYLPTPTSFTISNKQTQPPTQIVKKLLFGFILLLVVGVGQIGWGQTAGPNYPSTGANITDIGTRVWSNTGNIYSNDNSYSNVWVNKNRESNYLRGTNFGFSIPTNATITGIVVEIGKYRFINWDAIYDNEVKLVKNGTIVGSNKAKTGTNWNTSENNTTYGGTTDLWGTTWTPSELNNGNFGVVLAVSNPNNDWGFAYVDYIRVTVYYNFTTPTLVVSPTSLDLGYTASGSNSAVKSYDLSGVKLEGNAISIKPPVGFQISKNSTGPWTSSGSSLALTYSGSTLSATPIYVRFSPSSVGNYVGDIIISDNGNDNGGDSADDVMVKVSGTTYNYCTPTYSTGTVEGDYISSVQLGTINNSVGASASPYYTYFSSLSTDLTVGSSYTITLGSGTYNSANNISVWIDYNQNGSFETSEKLGNVTLAGSSTGTIDFTVPTGAVSGTTRMRVREVWNNTNIDACTNEIYGETEDYNVKIVIPCSNPTSGGTIATAQTICSGNDPAAFTSSAPASGQTGTLEYKWQYSTIDSPYSWQDAGATGLTYDDNTVLTASRWYQRLARVTCKTDWTGAAQSNPLKVTVTTPSTAPTSITGTTTICNGGTTTLTANGGTLGTGGTYQWGTGSTVGSNIISGATNASYTTGVLTSNTTYWVRRIDPAPCSTTTGGVSQLVSVTTPSTAPTSITGITTICSGGTTTLTATGGTLGTGGTYQWGTGPTVGSNTISGATNASYTTGVLTSNTTYWVRRIDPAPCSTTTVGVSQLVTVNTTSTAPTSITGTTTLCSGGTTTLTANGGTLGTGGTYQWGTGSVVGSNTISGATNASYTTGVLTSNTTYWVRRIDPAPCSTTTGGVSQLVSVNTSSTAPTSITGTTTICSGGTTTLTANGGTLGTGGTYQWGTGSTVGSNIISGATNASYTTGVLTSNTTYWVRRIDPAPCSTTTGGATQIVTVNPIPTATISSTNDPICEQDNAEFTITGTPNAEVTYNINGNLKPTVTLSSGGTITISYVVEIGDNDQELTLISVKNPTTNCTQSLTESETITVNPIPIIGGFN